MSAILESLLKGANPSTITEFFFWLIAMVLFLAIIFRKAGKAHVFVNYAATLLTSLGILGTFIGIVVGLLDFDAVNIDDSIGQLLAGLKTAFITSLVGMSASITYKVLGAISIFVKTEEVNLQDAGAEEICHAINEQKKIMHESSEAQQVLLADLKQAIAGSEDDALVSQIKLMKSDLKDRLDKSLKYSEQGNELLKNSFSIFETQHTEFQQFTNQLWEKLQNVADMISKSATEQVINALKEVIVDFNNNLIEQFGDNFKALDESVKKLVTWQENYSQQIEQMVEQYKQGVTAITQTEASVVNISEKTTHIPETMNNLKQVMEVNQHQVEELARHLEAFKIMRDKAVEAVPEIRKQVEETVSEVAKSVQTANEHYATLLTESDKYIKQHVEKSNEMLDKFVSNTKEGIEAVKSGLVEGTGVIGKDLRSSSEEVKKAIVVGAENFSKAVHTTNDSLTKTSNELEERFGVIAQQLKDTVSDINSKVRNMVEDIVENSKTIGESLKDSNQQINTNIKQVQDQVADNIDKMHDRLESTLEEVLQVQAREIRRTFDALEDEVKSTVSLTGEAVNKQLAMIDQSMEQEVEKVMQHMGNALASISGRFTEDYKELVKAMEDVVNQQVRR